MQIFLIKDLKYKEITIPPRPKNYKIVYHLYIVFAKNRDAFKILSKKGIEAKIHYPKPMYLQEKAIKNLKHKKGDFPVY